MRCCILSIYLYIVLYYVAYCIGLQSILNDVIVAYRWSSTWVHYCAPYGDAINTFICMAYRIIVHHLEIITNRR